jgi:hypothetical protein
MHLLFAILVPLVMGTDWRGPFGPLNSGFSSFQLFPPVEGCSGCAQALSSEILLANTTSGRICTPPFPLNGSVATEGCGGRAGAPLGDGKVASACADGRMCIGDKVVAPPGPLQVDGRFVALSDEVLVFSASDPSWVVGYVRRTGAAWAVLLPSPLVPYSYPLVADGYGGITAVVLNTFEHMVVLNGATGAIVRAHHYPADPFGDYSNRTVGVASAASGLVMYAVGPDIHAMPAKATTATTTSSSSSWNSTILFTCHLERAGGLVAPIALLPASGAETRVTAFFSCRQFLMSAMVSPTSPQPFDSPLWSTELVTDTHGDISGITVTADRVLAAVQSDSGFRVPKESGVLAVLSRDKGSILGVIMSQESFPKTPFGWSGPAIPTGDAGGSVLLVAGWQAGAPLLRIRNDRLRLKDLASVSAILTEGDNGGYMGLTLSIDTHANFADWISVDRVGVTATLDCATCLLDDVNGIKPPVNLIMGNLFRRQMYTDYTAHATLTLSCPKSGPSCDPLVLTYAWKIPRMKSPVPLIIGGTIGAILSIIVVTVLIKFVLLRKSQVPPQATPFVRIEG